VNQLYNELTSPVTETNDKGELVSKSPTSLMLRAARAIKQMDEVNASNNFNIQANQHQNCNLTKENQELTELIKQLRKEIESLRNGGQKASDVGSSWVFDQRLDSASEGGDASKDCNPSSS